jgi:hypothetical protein
MSDPVVAVIILLHPKDVGLEPYVILTPQPRLHVPQGLGIPTGTMAEINELIIEMGLKLYYNGLSHLQALLREQPNAKDYFPPTVDLPLLVYEQRLERKEIESLKGRYAAEHAQDGAYVHLRVCDFGVLHRLGDRKSEEAWYLYEQLRHDDLTKRVRR